MNNVVAPKDFSSAGKDIKLAILQARAKAAHFANAEAHYPRSPFHERLR
ncbi:MAG: hypothetical protein IJQ73_10605 [Kiritimatiellae bacterium]|nr:hypothetical protein [Kiritimatiellia bacterium]